MLQLNSDIEIKIFRFFGIEPQDCGQYDRLEQCCNTPEFCDWDCPYGAGGYKFLPFSSLYLKLCRVVNRIRYRKYYK